MLNGSYDIVTGKSSNINQNIHYFKLVNSDKLTLKDKLNLRHYIVKHKLPVTLDKKIPLDEDLSISEIISLLDYFRENIMISRPKFKDTTLSCLILLLMFVVPVYLAYFLSNYLQNHWLEPLIETLKDSTTFLNDFFKVLLFDSYGIISLGSYSIVWALPVVIFIAISTTVIAQTNMKSYIVWSIDPMMKYIGLTGYDIVPVIEGFGCNAAAVVNASHTCNACSKSNCVSLISFGSSCSYQIGATISLFSVIHLPWLFIPYLIIIFMGGIIHTKIWNPKTSLPLFYFNLEPLKMPNYKQTVKQSSEVIKSFLIQALPVFIFICLIASLLSMTSIIGITSNIFNMLLEFLNIPNKMSSGILFQ
ncbi:nucleoside recognition domain-containing protein [Staphylococcus saprophyticus]